MESSGKDSKQKEAWASIGPMPTYRQSYVDTMINCHRFLVAPHICEQIFHDLHGFFPDQPVILLLGELNQGLL